jgi:hypothetical protein
MASLPSAPPPKTLNKKQMRRYRESRDALVRGVATRMGRSVPMIDL